MNHTAKIHDFEQRSPEWYQIRESRITGTSVKSILGDIKLKKTKDAINNIAMIKSSEIVFGMTETDYINFDMQRGIYQEPSAFRLFQNILSKDFIEVKKVGFISFGEYIGVSPDGITSDNKGLEIKCPNVENFSKLVITDEIDESHYKQMQLGMLVTGFKSWHYFAYCVVNGKELYYHREIERDESMIDLMIERIGDVVLKIGEYIPKLKEITER